MKLKLNLLNGAACVCLVAFSARADESMPRQTYRDATNQIHEMRGMMRAYQLQGAVKTGDLTGSKVVNDDGQNLGRVNDLLLDLQAGRVVQVIVSSGGVLGVGGTLMAVPPGILRTETTKRTVHVDADKNKFQAGPKFVAMSYTEESGQSNAVVEVYNYYGERPFFVNARFGTNVFEEITGGPLPLNMDGTPAIGGGRLMDIANNQKVADDNGQDTNTLAGDTMMSDTNAAGAWMGGRHMHRAELGYLQRASKLKGMTVKNLQGDTVGTIKDFAVDLGAGRIVAVIISTGGFLDMGNELSAVPPTVLRYNGQHDGVEFDTTREALANAPHFRADQSPDIGEPAYAGNMYHAYRVNPYFSTNSYRDTYRNNGTADADNAGRNMRDRDGRNLTPMDQGNNAEDIRITSEIRKEVVANQGLSVNAKNVKIITVNGKVTLRGPVNTEEEKSTIGDIASHIVQSNNVDNQLEVRTTASN